MDLPGSLRLAIAAVMHEATPSLDWAADVAGVSSRTLRRRLDAIGLSWSGLIAQTRFNTARRLLETNDLEIRDVAREVGYSDPANFTRAFRRWTGESPSAYRARS
jgi:AraC-like DNA-binding protein